MVYRFGKKKNVIKVKPDPGDINTRDKTNMTCCEITLFAYVLWIHVFHINSTKTSSHWKLNVELGKIMYLEPTESEKSPLAKSQNDAIYRDDIVLTILTSRPFDAHALHVTVQNESQKCHINCHHHPKHKSGPSLQDDEVTLARHSEEENTQLQCGDESSNYATQYDDLPGIVHRNSHPQFITETDAILNVSVVDADRLEKMLRKAKQNKTHSVHIFNEVGVIWRIKGHVHHSLECFRRALSISPNNAKALLYLARLLLTLRYTDDAQWLTKKSLENTAADHNPWMQHYTMGELLKSRGHYPEAAAHFQLSLVHNPGFQLAIAQAKEVQAFLEPTDTMYTIFVAMFLITGVIIVILTKCDVHCVESPSSHEDPLRCQRHFNRAMAMRSIKMSISSRSLKLKRSHFLK